MIVRINATNARIRTTIHRRCLLRFSFSETVDIFFGQARSMSSLISLVDSGCRLSLKVKKIISMLGGALLDLPRIEGRAASALQPDAKQKPRLLLYKRARRVCLRL